MLGVTNTGKDTRLHFSTLYLYATRTVAMAIFFLFISSSFVSIEVFVQIPCDEIGILLPDHGNDSTPFYPPDTRQAQNESDMFGGSWFDDFTDDSGVAELEKCSIRDGSMQLDGTLAVDSWYYSDWPFRRQMIIENPSQEDLTDYQVNLSLQILPGMSYDFSDIRFTYYDPEDRLETKIPYWIQHKEDGMGAEVWLKVPEIPPAGKTTVIMYYGHFLAFDESDGDATFVFFDDFEGTALNLTKWKNLETDGKKDYAVSNGELFLYVHDVWDNGIVCEKRGNIVIDGHMLEARQKMEQGGTIKSNDFFDRLGFYFGGTDGSWNRYIARSRKEKSWAHYSAYNGLGGTIWKQGTWDGSETEYHVLGSSKFDNNINIFENSEPIAYIPDGGILGDGNSISISNHVCGFEGDGWGKLWTDWIRVRKTAISEPVVHLSPDSGVIQSSAISLPESMEWDGFSILKEEHGNTSILIDIMDAATNRTIPGFGNISVENVDISGLNGMGITSIRLRARLDGNRSGTPSLHSWGVEWVSKDVWRDSFIGDGKVFAGSNVDISGRATAGNLSNEAYLRSEMISLPVHRIWSNLFLYSTVPDGTNLNVTIHDWETGETVISETGITGNLLLDISSISPNTNRNISLRADLSPTPEQTPVLHNWGVRFSDDSIPPTARAGDDIIADQKDTVYFNGERSSDNLGIVNWSWSFIYRGEKRILYGRNAEFRFNDAGSFNITLEVTDAHGNRDADEIQVTVMDTTSPVANAGSNREADQHATLHFSGSESLDNTGIVNYTWSFYFDGNAVHSYGKETTFLFSIPGVYTVTLHVRDLEGNVGENSILVHVHDTMPPVVEAGENITAVQGMPIQLSGNGSSDNVGIENFTWLYFHRGSVNMSYGENVTIELDEPDEYIITLIVTDSEYNVASDNITVTIVEDNGGNSPENDTSKDTDGDGYNDTYENESGSDPYNKKSTPLDWDGDGVPNEKDAYPRDPDRWRRDDDKTVILICLFSFVAGAILFCVCYKLYTKNNRRDLLLHEMRKEIIACIDERPGRHFNELKRSLDVSKSTLAHHISKLEKGKIIYSVSDGYYTRYYLVGVKNNHETLSPIQERIIELLQERPELSYQDLEERMNKSISTLSYHVKTLVEKGVVKRRKMDRKFIFYLSDSFRSI